MIKLLADWLQYRTSVTELSRLSDRALEDIGVDRDNIRSVARQAPAPARGEVDTVLASRTMRSPRRVGGHRTQALQA